MVRRKWSVVFMLGLVILAALVGSLLRLPPLPPPIPDDIPDVDPEHFYNVSDNGSDSDSDTESLGERQGHPRVDPLWLMRVFDGRESRDGATPYFKIERVINPLPSFTKAVSVSLWCKAANNRYAREHPEPSRQPGGEWHSEMLAPVLHLIDHVTSRPALREFKVRVHVASDLARDKVVMQHFQDNRRVELHVMAHSSVGAQPGKMWQMLAWDDNSLECVCCIPNGEKRNTALACLEMADIYRSHPNHALFKLYGEDVAAFTLVKPVLIAERFSMRRLMRSYIAFASSGNRSPHKKPWHDHGFGDAFLAQVIMPAMLKQGLVVAVGEKEWVDGNPVEETTMLKRNPNNAVVRVQTMMLLE
jgi:hypothetical protein